MFELNCSSESVSEVGQGLHKLVGGETAVHRTVWAGAGVGGKVGVGVGVGAVVVGGGIVAEASLRVGTWCGPAGWKLCRARSSGS